VLPPLGIMAFEGMTLSSAHFASLLKYRAVGWYFRAFETQGDAASHANPLAAITPGEFLATPGLWFGLLFAAAFLALAVRLRRNREPI
jgi:ABC-2 type transport system permease protein